MTLIEATNSLERCFEKSDWFIGINHVNLPGKEHILLVYDPKKTGLNLPLTPGSYEGYPVIEKTTSDLRSQK